ASEALDLPRVEAEAGRPLVSTKLDEGLAAGLEHPNEMHALDTPCRSSADLISALDHDAGDGVALHEPTRDEPRQADRIVPSQHDRTLGRIDELPVDGRKDRTHQRTPRVVDPVEP